MPVPTEVDDLERQIVRFEEEIKKRNGRIANLKADIIKSNDLAERSKKASELCRLNLIRIKSLRVIPIQDYKDMLKLYEENCDLHIGHKTHAANRSNELKEVVDGQIPFFEGAIKECKRKLAMWGQVIPFTR